MRFGQPPRPTETYRGGTRRHIEFNTHAGLGALADMLGVEIDEFTEVREEIAAVEGFDTLAGRIEAGTKAGHRRVVTAIVKGQPFLTAEFVGRAARHVAPEWAGHDLDSSGHRWTVESDAVPNVTVSMDVTLDPEDPALPIANVPRIGCDRGACRERGGRGSRRATRLPQLRGPRLLHRPSRQGGLGRTWYGGAP